ncbi:hypothetical protein L3Q82_005210 [Scortum barcoo]|uniref:Uncharacterized protein n=1 Tax=Scortum barcoo TaxID=214431 RepID=A0ACB8VAM2_9TELE|nr:hypothetical protein L3Q82_005210 [Scortum barcoo]
MSFFRKGSGLSLRDRDEELRHPREARSRAAAHSRREEPVEVVLIRMSPGRLPAEVFQACPSGRRPQEQTQDTLEGLYLSTVLGNTSGSPLEELVEVAGERTVWASLLRLLPP